MFPKDRSTDHLKCVRSFKWSIEKIRIKSMLKSDSQYHFVDQMWSKMVHSTIMFGPKENIMMFMVCNFRKIWKPLIRAFFFTMKKVCVWICFNTELVKICFAVQKSVKIKKQFWSASKNLSAATNPTRKSVSLYTEIKGAY